MYAMLLLTGQRQGDTLEAQKQDAQDFLLSTEAAFHALHRVRVDKYSVFHPSEKTIVDYRRQVSEFLENQFVDFLEKASLVY